jgi:hypothetical protein
LATNAEAAAAQDADLLAKDPPDNEERFHQNDQVGKVLDQLLDARFELHRGYHAHLETEVAQGGAQIILNGDGLRLQQLAVRSFWLRNVFTCTGR